ncbi:MAG: hypothetical protein NT025_09375 [bacterium]|nr:hypothetical protein [bacterium]
MRVLLRLLLIGAALYLVIRYLIRLLFPARSGKDVQGAPRRRRSRIDEERISDASFKDISKK